MLQFCAKPEEAAEAGQKDQMNTEEDLNDVDGWLLNYVVLKYGGAVWATVPIILEIYASAINHRLPSHADVLPLLLISVSILTTVAAATAVLRTSRWALPLVGFDLLFVAMALIITSVVGLANGVAPKVLPLMWTAVRLAVVCAWFHYFRVSRRVHATLGRNLLEEAVEPD
jgi:hypothetical protein